MAGAILLWRIGADTPSRIAEDLGGHGARIVGGRWNRKRTSLIYASSSRALACLETLAHLDDTEVLPLNRYLVELSIPAEIWRKRRAFISGDNVGWDAEPAGRVSLDWGTIWAKESATLLAEVPSIIVPEESNVLINPLHRDISLISARKIRRWTYDRRMRLPAASSS